MKILWNVILGIGAVLSAAALIFQGFAFPALSSNISLILKITAAVCTQWLFLGLFQEKALQAIPIFIAAIAAVWGFFLYLSSPSWLGATFEGFLSDYASFLGGCILVWIFSWLLPRIIPPIRKALRAKKRKKSKNAK